MFQNSYQMKNLSVLNQKLTFKDALEAFWLVKVAYVGVKRISLLFTRGVLCDVRVAAETSILKTSGCTITHVSNLIPKGKKR